MAVVQYTAFTVGEFGVKNNLITWLIGAGLVIAYIGIRCRNPIVIGLAVGGLGVFGIFSGIQMIITKRANVPTSDSINAHKERHTGIAAQLWGFLFIMMGAIIVLIALGMTVFPFNSTKWVDVILDNSFSAGLFLISIGLLIAIYGIIRLIAGNAAYVETKLTPFERLAGGLYFLLFGLGILGAGIWVSISPSSMKAFFQFLVSLIGKLFIG